MLDPSSSGKTDLPRQIKDREWKAAGQPADWASAAYMLALREMHESNFLNFSALWSCALLQETHVFQCTGSGAYLVSLGAVRVLALGWVLEEVADSRHECKTIKALVCCTLPTIDLLLQPAEDGMFCVCSSPLSPKEAADRIIEMYLANIQGPDGIAVEEYEAVPCEPCAPLSSTFAIAQFALSRFVERKLLRFAHPH